jgi:hypothetical protein
MKSDKIISKQKIYDIINYRNEIIRKHKKKFVKYYRQYF